MANEAPIRDISVPFGTKEESTQPQRFAHLEQVEHHPSTQERLSSLKKSLPAQTESQHPNGELVQEIDRLISTSLGLQKDRMLILQFTAWVEAQSKNNPQATHWPIWLKSKVWSWAQLADPSGNNPWIKTQMKNEWGYPNIG